MLIHMLQKALGQADVVVSHHRKDLISRLVCALISKCARSI